MLPTGDVDYPWRMVAGRVSLVVGTRVELVVLALRVRGAEGAVEHPANERVVGLHVGATARLASHRFSAGFLMMRSLSRLPFLAVKLSLYAWLRATNTSSPVPITLQCYM